MTTANTIWIASTSPVKRAASWIFGALSLLVAVSCLAYLFLNIDRGFDLTDEAFYLQWIDHPAAFSVAQSLFGHVLSPIYHLLGEQPAALRRFGVLVTALSAAGLFWTVLQASQKPNEPLKGRGIAGATLIACAATTSATYYTWWITTPSYNWLPLPAAFLILVALLLHFMNFAEKLSSGFSALAGALAFAGKPTSGVAILIVYLVGSVLITGFNRRTLNHFFWTGIASGALLTLAALTLFDMRLAAKQLQEYVNFFGAAPATGSIFAGWDIPNAYYLALLNTAIAFSRRRTLARILGVVTLIAAAVAIYQMRGDASYARLQGVVVGTLCLSCVANFLAWRTHWPSRRLLALLFFAQVLPWLLAFGSGNGIVAQSTFYVALPIVGALGTAVLCFGTTDWRTMGSGLGATLAAVAALIAANDAPYRLTPPLLAQDQPVVIGGGRLRVDIQTSRFISKLRLDATAAGFSPGTPVIDFSGDTPGISFLLGGRSPVFPWLIGGYPFSERFASLIISKMTAADRQSAWLVYTDAPRPFNIDFMRSLGFDIGSGYDLVSEPLHPLYGQSIRLFAPRNRVSVGGLGQPERHHSD